MQRRLIRVKLQNKKVLISLLIFFLLNTILSFGGIKLTYSEEANEEVFNSTLFLENTTVTSYTDEEIITEKVYPEIEISTSIPESKATEEQSSKDEAIFEEDDKDFIPPPVAESE